MKPTIQENLFKIGAKARLLQMDATQLEVFISESHCCDMLTSTELAQRIFELKSYPLIAFTLNRISSLVATIKDRPNLLQTHIMVNEQSVMLIDALLDGTEDEKAVIGALFAELPSQVLTVLDQVDRKDLASAAMLFGHVNPDNTKRFQVRSQFKYCHDVSDHRLQILTSLIDTTRLVDEIIKVVTPIAGQEYSDRTLDLFNSALRVIPLSHPAYKRLLTLALSPTFQQHGKWEYPLCKPWLGPLTLFFITTLNATMDWLDDDWCEFILTEMGAMNSNLREDFFQNQLTPPQLAKLLTVACGKSEDTFLYCWNLITLIDQRAILANMKNQTIINSPFLTRTIASTVATHLRHSNFDDLGTTYRLFGHRVIPTIRASAGSCLKLLLVDTEITINTLLNNALPTQNQYWERENLRLRIAILQDCDWMSTEFRSGGSVEKKTISKMLNNPNGQQLLSEVDAYYANTLKYMDTPALLDFISRAPDFRLKHPALLARITEVNDEQLMQHLQLRLKEAAIDCEQLTPVASHEEIKSEQRPTFKTEFATHALCFDNFINYFQRKYPTVRYHLH